LEKVLYVVDSNIPL